MRPCIHPRFFSSFLPSLQTKTLALYVLSLAKYVTNYDIRDRARLLRALITNKV
jgi:hypothetical protein